MRILILGGTGMLGHRLWASLGQNHDVYATFRGPKDQYQVFPGTDNNKSIDNLDVTDFLKLKHEIKNLKPELVINCIGIIKQNKEASFSIPSITINSLLPHHIAEICTQENIRFIHFSTDCVFDGKKGNYNELDFPNAVELYGKSKHLGEVLDRPGCLTLRTSIIGREISPRGSLLEWFLSQNGTVRGYKNAIFSGFPTLSVAKILEQYIIPKPSLEGLYHLASDPIDKYELLCHFKNVFQKEIEITIDRDFKMNRSLDPTLIRESIGQYPMNWSNLLPDLLIDNEHYESLRVQ